MNILFPAECVTPASRLEFCYKAMDNVRRLHCYFSEWYRDGNIPLERWEGIPVEMKIKYPYMPQITQEVFEQFRREDADPAIEAICNAKGAAEMDAKLSEYWNPDFSNLVA